MARRTPPTDGAALRRYEVLRRQFQSRLGTMLSNRPGGVSPLMALLHDDEVLDALDQELTRIERQLPDVQHSNSGGDSSAVPLKSGDFMLRPLK